VAELPEDLTEGTVTVLFTDVEGSTELRARLGDQTAHELLRANEQLIRQEITSHGGRDVKGLGDGVMAAFGSARRAVACAAGIQRALEQHNREHLDENVAVRIGVNSGEVSEEGGDLFGTAVNAAARVAAKAKGGEILVSGVVKQLAGKVPDVLFVDRGRFRLKGFDERWQLFEVGWKREREPIAPVVIERTAFVGRDPERDEILGYLAAAAGGHGAVVMIAGEPGIGKTRLTEEIKAVAVERGYRARTGHCVEVEGGAPYMPIVEIIEEAIKDVDPKLLRDTLGDSAPEVARVVPHLRRLFPDIPPPLELPPEQERRYLFNSIREFIARAGANRPQVFVLDDLHWGDAATLQLLTHLAEHIHEMPVLILGTFREVELDASKPLARTVEDFMRRRLAHRVRLKRLPLEAVAQMLKILARGQDPPAQLVDVIHGETEGNPFFVEEVFQHLNEAGRLFDAEGRWRTGLDVSEADVPAGVRLVIGRRLERLGEDGRQGLATAAVIGRSFSYRLLEAATDLSPDALLDAVDAAERAQLIVATSEGAEANFVFAHELIRQTLLANVSLPRRQRWHLRVADAMERVFGAYADEHATELAHHLFIAGEAADPARAARYLRMAGDRATDAAAYEDALRSYASALNLQPPDDRRAHAELLSQVGLTNLSLGHWDVAMETLGRAVDEFEALGEGQDAGRVCYRMAFLLTWGGHFQEALEVAGRGLTALGGKRTGERASLLAICGVAIAVAGGHDLGGEMLTQAMDVATELGDSVLLADVQRQLSIYRWSYGRYQEALELGLQAADRFRAAGMIWELADVLSWAGASAVTLGQLDRGLEIHAELAPLARRVGHNGAQMVDLRSMISIHYAAGEFDAAEGEAREDLEICLGSGLPFYRDAYIYQGGVAIARGDWERGVELYRQAGEYDFPYVNAPWEPAALFWALARTGKRADAMAQLERLREDMPVLGVPNGWGQYAAALYVIEGLIVLGELEMAAELLPLAEATLELGWVMFSPSPPVRLQAAMAAAAGEMWDRAAEHFRLARVDAQALGGTSVANTDYWEAWALLRRGAEGDREHARELSAQAIQGYRRLGMPRHVVLAEELAERADEAASAQV
jgi:class 3 adenylate cyclase/tetratricopeptide (TPR) repeat protein